LSPLLSFYVFSGNCFSQTCKGHFVLFPKEQNLGKKGQFRLNAKRRRKIRQGENVTNQADVRNRLLGHLTPCVGGAQCPRRQGRGIFSQKEVSSHLGILSLNRDSSKKKLIAGGALLSKASQGKFQVATSVKNYVAREASFSDLSKQTNLFKKQKKTYVAGCTLGSIQKRSIYRTIGPERGRERHHHYRAEKYTVRPLSNSGRPGGASRKRAGKAFTAGRGKVSSQGREGEEQSDSGIKRGLECSSSAEPVE